MVLGSALTARATSVTAEFTLTNNGSTAFDGCFGPSWGVSVIVGGADAPGPLVRAEHPSCAESPTLLPGQQIVWSKKVPLSNLSARHGESHRLGEVVDPAACDPSPRLPRDVRGDSDDDGRDRRAIGPWRCSSSRSMIPAALFISPAFDDWAPLEKRGIDTVIDLDGDLDRCIPTIPNQVLYIYFPILDENLPDLPKLNAIADLGASLIHTGHRVLSHCGMGFNRSALVADSSCCDLAADRKPSGGCAPVGRRALFNEVFARTSRVAPAAASRSSLEGSWLGTIEGR